MSHSTLPDCEPNSASTLPEQPGVLVVRKHHLLVRWSHWLNVPILLGLILSGISIYWASPIYQHKPDPNTGNTDVAADIGIWICAHVPGQHHYSSPPDWIYNHMSLGPSMLALALRLHWLCAYLPARSILLGSTRRIAFGRYRLGNSQAHAIPLAGRALWRVQRSACLAFLADVGLHPLRRAACDSGFRRRMGYVAQHDRRLVNKSRTVGGRRK